MDPLSIPVAAFDYDDYGAALATMRPFAVPPVSPHWGAPLPAFAYPENHGHVSTASGTRPYSRQWWYDDAGDGIYHPGGEDKVCMSAGTYRRLSMRSTANDVRARDMRVLFDPLYPALDRTSSTNQLRTIAERNAFVNLPTQPMEDTYRLVGYLVNNVSVTPRWKLFGRLTNRSRGDFYMMPANGDDIKVPITHDMIVGRERLDDFYTIPDTLTFRSPLLEATPYTFVPLPRSDLQDMRYV